MTQEKIQKCVVETCDLKKQSIETIVIHDVDNARLIYSLSFLGEISFEVGLEIKASSALMTSHCSFIQPQG